MVEKTATGDTVTHYVRNEVYNTIYHYCLEGADSMRALNADYGWYKRGDERGTVRLTNIDDYLSLIQKHRTIYATLDFFEPSVWGISEKWDEHKRAPAMPIGTFRDCLAFTPSVDIDSIKGTNGENITTSSEIKTAVEAAGQFFVDSLREHDITKSVHCLYSGGGLYVHVHHALFRARLDWSTDDREMAFRSITTAFNALIGVISNKFFEAYPEHKGRVKFDQLNNQKRKFKSIFSIHKTLPFAVIPLNPDHIEIDFNRARLPLSTEVLAEGQSWYQSYDLEELPKLKELLRPYVGQAEAELKKRGVRNGAFEVRCRPTRIPVEDMPPCMKNIIQTASPGRGPHRALSVLAAYLYQAGWPEDEAFKLWKTVAERAGVEARIFDQWYGLMNCPNCQTIQRESAGYPQVGLGGLGYCVGGCQCQ